MIRAVVLGGVLFVTWLLLSGIYQPLIIGFGVVSCAFVAFIAARMDVADHEGHPIHLSFQVLLYLPWLIWEIIKSNIDIARIIVDPGLPIQPRVFTVKTSQQSELGQVIYANSITLTPGTVSLTIEGDEIEVHALTKASADDLETGEMDRRVSQVEAAHVAEKA